MSLADDAPENLVAALVDLVQSQARDCRLILRAGAHWQVLGQQASQRELVHLSAKSSRLPDAHKLNTLQATQMRAMGFDKKADSGDWQRRLPRAGVRESARPLATEMHHLVRSLYRSDAHIQLDLELDDREHPLNPELLAAMRKLADRGGSDEDRHAMYNAMANANFLVLPDATADASVDPEDALAQIEELQGRPVFAAFTDMQSLRAYAPLQRDYLPFHGGELFALLEGKRAGALQINPQGRVGGELFAHEIEALAEGVRRFLRKRMN